VLQVVHHPATVRTVDLCSSPCVWPRGVIMLGGARLLLTGRFYLVPRSLSPRPQVPLPPRGLLCLGARACFSPEGSSLVPRSLSPRGGRAPKGRGDERFLMLRTNTKSVYYVTYEYKIRILHHLLKCCCPVDRTQFTKSGLTWRIRFDKQALLKTCVLFECY